MEPPLSHKSSSAPPSLLPSAANPSAIPVYSGGAAANCPTHPSTFSFASIVSGGGAQGPVGGGVGLSGADQQDFSDLMSIVANDKGGYKGSLDHVSRHLMGLLEVEPLHFTCHATSDGTRMERLDLGTATSYICF